MSTETDPRDEAEGRAVLYAAALAILLGSALLFVMYV
jgi:hypothetical protein